MNTPAFTQRRNMLADIIKNPYFWPGCYEKLLVTTDGGLLCAACCRKEARRIMSDIRDGYETGWIIDKVTYEATGPEDCPEECKTNCSHCGKEIGELGL